VEKQIITVRRRRLNLDQIVVVKVQNVKGFPSLNETASMKQSQEKRDPVVIIVKSLANLNPTADKKSNGKRNHHWTKRLSAKLLQKNWALLPF